MIGSHLDSVPQGGNYDGAAGVVAGLSALSALTPRGHVPACDFTVMGIRAEESAWFDIAYLGSAGAFGLLDPACLAIRDPTTVTHWRRPCGSAASTRKRFGNAAACSIPSGIRAYLELHIEQGPTLVARGLPAAVVTGIRGCKRFRNARCTGAYAHSGAVDRPYRQDAVAATVALLHHMETVWLQQEAGGSGSGAHRAVNSTPTLPCTDRARLPVTRASCSTCAACRRRPWRRSRRRLALPPRASVTAYRVAIDLGTTSDSPAALMDGRLRTGLMSLLETPFEMASGAGHDAAVFAKVGIPSGMIFVRNDNGSHNADEAMALEDFAVGTRALLGLLLDFPSDSRDLRSPCDIAGNRCDGLRHERARAPLAGSRSRGAPGGARCRGRWTRRPSVTSPRSRSG